MPMLTGLGGGLAGMGGGAPMLSLMPDVRTGAPKFSGPEMPDINAGAPNAGGPGMMNMNMLGPLMGMMGGNQRQPPPPMPPMPDLNNPAAVQAAIEMMMRLRNGG